MSVLWLVVVFVLGFIIGGTIFAGDKTTTVNCKRCRGRNWHIWVEGTSDPSKYRGKYSRNGRVRYNVQDNGVTNTLESLAEEINGVDTPSQRDRDDPGYE